jgi:BON domain
MPSREWSGDEGEGRAGQALVFLLGAAGGLAVGMLLSGRLPEAAPARGVGSRLRDGARSVAANLRPGRMRRELREQVALTALEDAVLDAFLRDELLSERAVDVGAISRGIVELSGAVRTADEAERAVRLARRVDGVETVVNRMEVEDELSRRRGREGEPASGEERMPGEWTGREVGMGRRRQGPETEPNRADDSQHQREMALEQADRAQFEDEELAHSRPRVSSRPGTGEVNPTHYREDELDNQDPYGKHAVPVPEQPQAMNSQSRVGEGLKPGTELALEAADVPVKPHSHQRPGAGTDDGGDA